MTVKTIGTVLDSGALVPVSFSMTVETIGEALDLGWRVTVRCSFGPRDGMKRGRECVYGGELDLPTLVWTRGREFPLDLPRCRSGASSTTEPGSTGNAFTV